MKPNFVSMMDRHTYVLLQILSLLQIAPRFALTTECEQKIASCEVLFMNRSYLVAFSYSFFLVQL